MTSYTHTAENIVAQLPVLVENSLGNLVASFRDLESAGQFLDLFGLNWNGDPLLWIAPQTDPATVPFRFWESDLSHTPPAFRAKTIEYKTAFIASYTARG